MKHYTCSRSSLACLGMYICEERIWEEVERRVHIPMKTVHYRPTEKLLDILLTILSGAKGLVEANTRVRPEVGLQRAFGRSGCAEQSTLSTTLNHCEEEQVLQMMEVLQVLFARYAQTARHDYEEGLLIVDVDVTPLPGGRQGEGVEKGHFGDQPYTSGRQLARMHASQYDEIVVDQLNRGKEQLDRKLVDLVERGQQVLRQSPAQKARTLLRIDAGAGDDQNIEWVLQQGYQILVKVKNYQRGKKLCNSVPCWYPDPNDPKREVGWISAPHPYRRETRQIGIRTRSKDGTWHPRVLVTSLTVEQIYQVAGWKMPARPGDEELLWAIMHAYDLRGGGVETSNRDSKQGLHLDHRNKKKLSAQRMLILLAQLAYNLLTWFARKAAAVVSAWKDFGKLRWVRDLLAISGRLTFDPHGNLIRITLLRNHPAARSFQLACAAIFGPDDPPVILRKI